MSIFKNKKEFRDNTKVKNLLDKLEVAHKNQDELACAVLLTKLKQLNIEIVVDKTE